MFLETRRPAPFSIWRQLGNGRPGIRLDPDAGDVREPIIDKIAAYVFGHFQINAAMALLVAACSAFVLAFNVQDACDDYFHDTGIAVMARGYRVVVLFALGVVSGLTAVMLESYPALYEGSPPCLSSAALALSALSYASAAIADFLGTSELKVYPFDAVLAALITVLALLSPGFPIVPAVGYAVLCAAGLAGLASAVSRRRRLAADEEGRRHRKPNIMYCTPIACSILTSRKYAMSAAVAVLCGLCTMIALDGRIWDGSPANNPACRGTFLGYCCLCHLLIALWIAMSRAFRKDLETTIGLVDSQGYRQLVHTYRIFCGMPRDDFDARASQAGSAAPRKHPPIETYSRTCTAVWWFGWLGYAIFIGYCALCLRMPPLATYAFLLSLLTVFFINGSSYYVCACYAWFLKEIAKLPDLTSWSHFATRPTQSPIYASLAAVARRNSLFFFAEAFAFAVLMTLSLVIAWTSGYTASPVAKIAADSFFPSTIETSSTFLVACTIGTVIIAIIGYGVIFSSSRISLNRIAQRWRDNATASVLRAYERDVLGATDGLLSPSLQRHTALLDEINSTEKMSRADSLNAFLGAATLAANVVALAVAILSLVAAN